MVRYKVKPFVENIADRCDEAPVATAAREVGSFRFFGDEP
jgi:hypothetical protein